MSESLTLQFRYGLRKGKLTHIRDVESGLACECVCPACDSRLIAKKGKKRVQHFAHAGGSDCPSGLETTLHLAAKEIIESKREIVLPEVRLQFYSPEQDVLLSNEERYQIDSVVLETKVGDIIPDVIANVKGRRILIEIMVTHAVDDRKLSRIRQLGYSAIEIDLSGASRDFSPEELERLVLGSGSHKRWIFNGVAAKRYKAILASGIKFRTKQRGYALHVDGCPIAARVWKGKAYANVVDDCNSCKYALNIGLNMNSVTCVGHKNCETR